MPRRKKKTKLSIAGKFNTSTFQSSKECSQSGQKVWSYLNLPKLFASCRKKPFTVQEPEAQQRTHRASVNKNNK